MSFDWTVPADGPAGYSIEAVIREKKPVIGCYGPVSSYSDTFTAEPDCCLTITEAVQDGDQFRVSCRVANRGNAPAEEGTNIALELVGLYGDLDSQLYGNVKDPTLYSADITDKLPAKTVSVNQDNGTGSVMKSVYEDEQMVTIPASVFRHCGYDALTLLDADDNTLATTSQKLVAMDAPMKLSLNDGKSLSLTAGQTATLMTSGRSVSIPVTVNAVFLAEGENMVNVPAQSSVIRGKTTVEPSVAKEGDTVTPDPGYQVTGVVVKDAEGNLIPVTDNSNGTYTFTMPATAVNVLPAFGKTGSDVASVSEWADCEE